MGSPYSLFSYDSYKVCFLLNDSCKISVFYHNVDKIKKMPTILHLNLSMQ